MDVFSTQSLQSAQFILGLFLYIGVVGEYNASALNASQAIINQSAQSLEGGTVEPGYLFSVLSSSSSISKTALVM